MIAQIIMNLREMNSKSYRWQDVEKFSFLRRNFLFLIAWPIGAFILAAIGWGILFSRLNDDRNKIDSVALKEAAALSKAYSDHLSQTLYAIDQIILHVRYEWEITDGRLQLETIQEKGLFSSDSIFRVGIVDRAGEILTRTYKVTVIREGSLSERPYFLAHKNSTKDFLYIDTPIFERSTGTNRIRFSRRLLQRDGAFNGVILVNIASDYFTANYDNTILGRDGFLGIVGNDGFVRVTRMGATVQPPESPALVSVPSFARPNGSVILTGHKWFSDKRSRYVGWHPVKGYPLIAMTGLDEQDTLMLYQTNRDISIRNAIWATIFLLVFTFMSMAFSMRHAWKKHQLNLKQASYRRATEGGNEGFYISRPIRDTHGNLVDFETTDCNSKGAAFYHLSREELIGRRISSFYESADFARVMKRLCQAMELGFYESELEVFGEGPFTARWISLKIVRSGEDLALTISDISETKTHAAELERRTSQDELTGLPNRHWLQAVLPQEIAQAERENTLLALLFVDLDGFKMVNDMFGRAAGDELLCNVARRMRIVVRPNDHVVRFGGDEFVVILTHIEHIDYAAHLAQSILHSLKESFNLSKGTLTIGASIGISLFPKDGRDAEVLLQNADVAMYSAKTIEKGSYRFFEPHFHEALRARLEKELELKHAIECDEFIMYYQPRIDLSTGLTCSMEALIRWRHPSKGLIDPLDFIPLAEETGLVVGIGELVIDKVCAQVADWARQSRELVPVSINVSARQFNETDVAGIFSAALSRHNITPEMVEIEITESSMMGGHRDFSKTFAAIQKMGIKLLVDDFGTGYSSLSQLQQLDFDILKVDIAFTSRLEKSEEGKVFVKAIITMAHALGMRVVAEGVENESQINILKSLRCDEAQGFYFSRPLPPTTTQAILSRRFFPLTVHAVVK